MVLLSSKFLFSSCSQPSVWLASVFHRPMDTRYSGRSIIIIKRCPRISVLPFRHQQRYLSLPTLVWKSQAGFLALTISGTVFCYPTWQVAHGVSAFLLNRFLRPAGSDIQFSMSSNCICDICSSHYHFRPLYRHSTCTIKPFDVSCV